MSSLVCNNAPLGYNYYPVNDPRYALPDRRPHDTVDQSFNASLVPNNAPGYYYYQPGPPHYALPGRRLHDTVDESYNASLVPNNAPPVYYYYQPGPHYALPDRRLHGTVDETFHASLVRHNAPGYYNYYSDPHYALPNRRLHESFNASLVRNNAPRSNHFPGYEFSLKVGDPIDVLSYLFTPQRDYLVRTGIGNQRDKVYASDLVGKKYIAIFCFYIPFKSVKDHVALLCYQIMQIFSELRREGKSDFEAVLVTRIRPDFPPPYLTSSIFSNFISLFDGFLAVPLLDSDPSTEFLFSFSGTIDYCVNGLLVADLEDQKVVLQSVCASTFISFGAYFYPFTLDKLSLLYMEHGTIGNGMPLETLFGCETSRVLERISAGGVGETVSSLKNKVIWIFLLIDGQRLDQVCDLYLQCKSSGYEFEVVLVNALFTKAYWRMSWEEYRRPVNSNPVCCSWLELPYSDKVSRRLWLFSMYPMHDKLLIVGPNGSYVEPDAFENYQRFGIHAYPFNKQTVLDEVVDKLQRLRLMKLLEDVGISYLYDSNGNKVQLSGLKGVNVVLFFSDLPPADHSPCWEDNVPMWFEEFKSRGGEPFEIIFVCTSQPDDVSLRDYLSKLPWLAVPNDKHRVDTLLKKLFGIVFSENTLVAFRSDGHLLTLWLHEKLRYQSKFAPWSFAGFGHATDLVADARRIIALDAE